MVTEAGVFAVIRLISALESILKRRNLVNTVKFYL